MKKIGILIIVLSLFFACNNSDELLNVKNETTTQEKIDEDFPRISINSKIAGVKLPNGTIMDKVDDSTIKMTFPKGYELWQLGEDGRFEVISESSYTCTCSGDNGCNVFHVKDEYGCSHGSCTGSCTGKFNNSFTHARFYVLNVNSRMQAATDKEFEDLDYLPGELVSQFKKELESFAKSLYGANYQDAIQYVDKAFQNPSSSQNITFVKMKMYGYKFVYGINTQQVKPDVMKSNTFTTVDDGKKHECKCNSGSSGCTADSSWGVKYCEGGACTSCTMTVN